MKHSPCLICPLSETSHCQDCKADRIKNALFLCLIILVGIAGVLLCWQYVLTNPPVYGD